MQLTNFFLLVGDGLFDHLFKLWVGSFPKKDLRGFYRALVMRNHLADKSFINTIAVSLHHPVMHAFFGIGEWVSLAVAAEQAHDLFPSVSAQRLEAPFPNAACVTQFRAKPGLLINNLCATVR